MIKKKTTVKSIITAEEIADLATVYYILSRFIFRFTKRRKKDSKTLAKILEKRAYTTDGMLQEVLKKFEVKICPNLTHEEIFNGNLGEEITFETHISFDSYEEYCNKIRALDKEDGGHREQNNIKDDPNGWIGSCIPVYKENSVINVITIRKDLFVSDIHRTYVCTLIHEVVHQTDHIELYVKDILKKKIKKKELINIFHTTVEYVLMNLYGMN